jgi:hypothetical protein
MDQHDNQYVEDDMTHNYAHGFTSLTIPSFKISPQKVTPFAHAK